MCGTAFEHAASPGRPPAKCPKCAGRLPLSERSRKITVAPRPTNILFECTTTLGEWQRAHGYDPATRTYARAGDR